MKKKKLMSLFTKSAALALSIIISSTTVCGNVSAAALDQNSEVEISTLPETEEDETNSEKDIIPEENEIIPEENEIVLEENEIILEENEIIPEENEIVPEENKITSEESADMLIAAAANMIEEKTEPAPKARAVADQKESQGKTISVTFNVTTDGNPSSGGRYILVSMETGRAIEWGHLHLANKENNTVTATFDNVKPGNYFIKLLYEPGMLLETPVFGFNVSEDDTKNTGFNFDVKYATDPNYDSRQDFTFDFILSFWYPEDAEETPVSMEFEMVSEETGEVIGDVWKISGKGGCLQFVAPGPGKYLIRVVSFESENFDLVEGGISVDIQRGGLMDGGDKVYRAWDVRKYNDRSVRVGIPLTVKEKQTIEGKGEEPTENTESKSTETEGTKEKVESKTAKTQNTSAVSSNSKVPKTGDHTPLQVYGITVIASLIGMVVLHFRKKYFN